MSFWYTYVKPKNGKKKAKLCYMDTDSFLVYIKTEDISVDISKDFETRFGTSNYEWERPFPKGENETVNALMNDKLGGKITT